MKKEEDGKKRGNERHTKKMGQGAQRAQRHDKVRENVMRRGVENEMRRLDGK